MKTGETVSISRGQKPAAMVEQEKKMAIIQAGKDPVKVESSEVDAENSGDEQPEQVVVGTHKDITKALKRMEALLQKHFNLEPLKAPKVGDPQIVVKVENEHIEFQFMAYEFFVEEFTIPILVDKDSFQAMPKSSQGFVLTVDGDDFPVIFIGKPVQFNTIGMGFITFMRDQDREQIQT